MELGYWLLAGILLVFVGLLGPQAVGAVDETYSPHDEEVVLAAGEPEFVVCKNCHGYSNLITNYGEPASGQHRQHMELLSHAIYRGELFLNNSYKMDLGLDLDRDGKVDITNINNRTWDICDECHAASVPLTEQGVEVDHILPTLTDRVLIRTANIDGVGGWDAFAGSCSGLSSRCHPTSRFSGQDALWGDPSTEDAERYYEEVYRKQNCQHCHTYGMSMTTDNRTSMLFSDSYQEMCDRCHSRYQHSAVNVSHPVNVKLPERMMGYLEERFTFDERHLLPLEEDQFMTCVTCHNPHGDSCRSCHFDYGNRDVYRTFIKHGGGEKALLRTDEEVVYDNDLHLFKSKEDVKKLEERFCAICHSKEMSAYVFSENPHLERNCLHCHLRIPYEPSNTCLDQDVDEYSIMRQSILEQQNFSVREKKELKESVEVLCQFCHDDVEHDHPLNVAVEYNIDRKLPLNFMNKITCYTCHDVHQPFGDKEDTTLVVYRMQKEDVTLCDSCHNNDPKYKAQNPHYRSDRCNFCHLAKSSDKLLARGAKLPEWKRGELYSRCNICHISDPNTHPVDVYAPLDVEEKFALDMRQKMVCGTCHDPHEPRKLVEIDFKFPAKYDTTLLLGLDKRARICYICHLDQQIELAHPKEP